MRPHGPVLQVGPTAAREIYLAAGGVVRAHARTCLYEAALLQPHPSNVKATVETRQVYNLVLLLKGLLVRMLAPTTSARLCGFCQYNTSCIDAQPSLKLATLLLPPVRCLESCC
jgi:hypothetical protein